MIMIVVRTGSRHVIPIDGWDLATQRGVALAYESDGYDVTVRPRS